MKVKYPFVIGLFVIIVPILIGQVMKLETPAPPKPKKVTPRKKEVNPYLERVLEEYEEEVQDLSMRARTPGFAVAVVYDSTIVYLKPFGVKSVGDADSVDVNTVFRLASVSKCFASFLSGILVEDHALAWNDTIVKSVPNFALKSKEETGKLTVGNVLSHTTGLPYHAYTNMVEEGASLDSMLSWLKNINLATKVGKAYSYQNVAYSLIGKVIEARTGISFEQQMIQKVFIPLKMNTASIDYESIIQNENVAKPHVRRRGRWKTAPITNTYYNVSPAAGVNASITDMANWLIALLGNRPDVISPQTLQQLYTPRIKAQSKNRNYSRLHQRSRAYYGLGWRVLYYPNDTLLYHGGYVNGYRSEVAVDPKDKIAVCILTNAPGKLADNGIPLFFKLFEIKRDSISYWEEEQRKKLLNKIVLQ
jgi:beta-lactamase class C